MSRFGYMTTGSRHSLTARWLPTGCNWSNECPLIPIITATDDRCSGRDPLDVVAGKINALWKKSDDQYMTIAQLLKESKERVESGEDKRFQTFEAWCHELLPGRSDSDVQRA